MRPSVRVQMEQQVVLDEGLRSWKGVALTACAVPAHRRSVGEVALSGTGTVVVVRNQMCRLAQPRSVSAAGSGAVAWGLSMHRMSHARWGLWGPVTERCVRDAKLGGAPCACGHVHR